MRMALSIERYERRKRVNRENAVKPQSCEKGHQTRMDIDQQIWTLCRPRFYKLDIGHKRGNPRPSPPHIAALSASLRSPFDDRLRILSSPKPVE
jgi:hypothetical protein